MKYKIEREDPVPAYLQLYRQLREDILQENYPYNAKMPSKRLVAGELEISTVTVEHAYALLCEEGYIEARERSGYYVIFRTTDGFTSAPEREIRTGREEREVRMEREAERDNGRGLADTLGKGGNSASGTFSGGERASAPPGVSQAAVRASAPPGVSQAAVRSSAPPGASQAAERSSASAAWEFPFTVLAKTMRKVIADRGEAILDRSPNLGREELRGAISRYLARSRGISAGMDQIVIGSGSEYLYGLIVELLGRDRIYAIESPSYKKIEQVYRACDVRLEKLPLGGDGIESAALWSCTADVLHISPYRSFPSGVTATASKRHEYLRWAGRGGRYLVEDDFESEFSILKKPEDTLFAHTSDENVIYMNTFSQTVSPSLRVGYMVLPRRLVPAFEEKLGFYSCTVPTYLQYVLAELISSGDFERHINRVRRRKRERMKNAE